MYSRSRGGKTTQIAELAEHLNVTQGKKSLVYSIDKGGIGPMIPHIELGVIDLVLIDETNPFMFLDKLAGGYIRDAKGLWVKADLSQYAMVAIEGITGFGDALMNDLANKAAQGISIGGAANVNFQIASDNETLKVGGSNMAHYGIAQTRLLDEIWKSQKLPVQYVVWTASASKDEDQNAGGKVIGPAGPGNKLTAELPRHFDLTFRLDCLPASGNGPEKHVLYLGNTVDLAAGNATGLGNTRVPLNPGAKELDSKIEPASLVKALQLIEGAEKAAKEALKKRLEAAATVKK